VFVYLILHSSQLLKPIPISHHAYISPLSPCSLPCLSSAAFSERRSASNNIVPLFPADHFRNVDGPYMIGFTRSGIMSNASTDEG